VVVVYAEIVPGSAVARGMEVPSGKEDVRKGCGRIVNAAMVQRSVRKDKMYKPAFKPSTD